MKILFATDGSENSDGAARFLRNLSFSGDDEITVIHAISSVPFQDDKESYFTSLQRVKRETGSKILDAAVTELEDAGAKISTALIDGHPDRIIPEAASESGADLIVMGARGLRGIVSFVVGSVTRTVTIESTKPVLVVKPQQWDRSVRLKILFATDGSDSADAAAKCLISIPFRDDTEMTVLDVVLSAYQDIPERFAMEIDDRVKNEVASARAAEFAAADNVIGQSRTILGTRFAKIEDMKKFGIPSTEILNAAETLDADIIAVGCRGMRGVKGMLGSVSRHVLNHARCSVLIGGKE
jgi:nucleotide-binding universal stress UspA family protein